MDKAAGERIIGGLSVGAEFTVLSVLLAPQLYDRAWIFSPFLNVAVWYRSLLLDFAESPLTNWGPIHLKRRRASWGEGCEKREREGGRAGICQFRSTHVAAARSLGHAVVKQAAKTHAIRTQVDVLMVDHDPVASVGTGRKLFQRLHADRKSFCLLPRGVNHSFLSRYDSPDEDKYWITPVQAAIGRSLDTGGSICSELSLRAPGSVE
jgi:hypothetical protein